MKQLHFDYSMHIGYSIPVSKCYFTIKCLPQDSARQRVGRLTVGLEPEVPYEKSRDSFGNLQIYGTEGDPHCTFQFRVAGDVEAGILAEPAAPACYETMEAPEFDMRFRHPHGLNRAGEQLRSYFLGLPADRGQPPYARSVALMHALHRDFAYEKNVTDVKTGAEEAWALGHGVCQDYAHIMIALCHLAGIPARYVTGMLIGEGASHAWVEVLDGGKWYGLDPTNDVAVTDSHIRIGIGRDASDCLINRGVMIGGGDQVQEIRVSVEETEVGGQQ